MESLIWEDRGQILKIRSVSPVALTADNHSPS